MTRMGTLPAPVRQRCDHVVRSYGVPMIMIVIMSDTTDL